LVCEVSMLVAPVGPRGGRRCANKPLG